MNYEECVTYLLNIPKFSKKTTLDNLAGILNQMGNPQDKLKVIHVAGTNGKGSVCAFLNTMLNYCGKKTGMFTSPHLVKINERMQIDGVMIGDKEFVEIFCQIKKLVEYVMQKGYSHPSFFEFLFLMAVVYFEKNQVEYAIFEVGLGGRLDATNSIRKPEVSVITSISLDHTEILGDTVAKIAGEKAGIIKEDVPVVFYHSSDEAAAVVKKKAEEKHTELYILYDKEIKIHKISSKRVDFSLHNRYYMYDNVIVSFPAAYQAVNSSLALLTFEIIRKKDKTITYKEHPYSVLYTTRWEGRMEQVQKNVFLDGGHNLSGITEFVRAVKHIECSGRRFLLFGALIEKDYKNMIECLANNLLWDKIYIVQIDNKRAVKMEQLAADFQKFTENTVICGGNVAETFRQAMREKRQEDMLFCAGSLYLAGELKGYLEVGHD